MASKRPLEGIKVIDFSAVYAGPICTRMLSDCGADVVKIEPTRGGDVIRGVKGTNRVFAHFNSGKRSVAIDLARPEGAKVARQLIADADILVENFRPGVMAKFGLDYASLQAEHPQLVYCSISGFGQSGPYKHRAAYAPIAHAASGFDIAHMRNQGDPEIRPPIWGIMVADMLTGSYAFGAIQTAMVGRERNGHGDYIDVTMIESMMMLIPGQIQTAQMVKPPPHGGFHPIQASDGFVMVCIVSEKNLRCLCEAMNRPDILTDPRYQPGQRPKHSAEFINEIESWSRTRTTEECEAQLNRAGVPCSTYTAPEDLFTHPQLIARESFTKFEDATSEFFVQNAPFQFASADTRTPPVSPLLGADTLEVLRSRLALSDAELESLVSAGAIHAG